MALLDPAGEVPEPYRFIAALWLSFLLAGAIGTLLFTLIDPAAIAPCTAFSAVSELGFYTIGFLFLWLITALASLGTLYFLYPRRHTPTDRQRPASP